MNRRMSVFLSIIILFLANWVNAQTATVYINDTDQTISGFGGMNFPRWIPDLTEEQADKAFGNGFGQIGLSILRVSIAPDKNQWSRELATAQRAKSYGAKVFATPWSPPASFKTNNSTTKGSIKDEYFNDYANHLRDYANYMESNGVPLYAISIQNEPDYVPDYESCGWTTTQLRTFLDNHASSIPTKVMAPETVHYKATYMDAIKGSSEVDIFANHAYDGSPTRVTNRGSKEHWMSEHAFNSSGDANDMVDALAFAKEIHDFMVNGYNAYVFWYIRRAYGLLTEDGNVSKRGFTMGHFSKFVRPGFQRVETTESPTSGVSVTSYKDGDTLVIVAINQNSSSKTINFNFSGADVSNINKWETTQTSGNNVSDKGSVIGGTSFSSSLTGRSITTFRGTIENNGSSSSGSDYYLMSNRNSDMCLRVKGSGNADNTDIIQDNCNNTWASEQFLLNDLNNGYFQIKNKQTNKCLRAFEGNVVQYSCYDDYWTEMFTREQASDGYYIYKNRSAGQCLRVSNSSKSAGASIVLDSCNTSHYSQQFLRKSLGHL